MDTFEESASRMIECMLEAGRRQQAPAQFVIGTVVEVSGDGLRVFANGIELKAEDLWINEDLLPGYCPQLRAVQPLAGTGYHGPCRTPVTEAQLTRGKHALDKNDRVVLLTEDWQVYYLIAKVVRL